MLEKYTSLLLLILLLITACQSPLNENKTDNREGEVLTTIEDISTKDLVSDYIINGIVRNIIQDKSGLTWLATFNGMFKYDGHTFTNFMKDISKSRFFSVYEDKKGDLWFGSVGSGVYKYDGKTFQNFTTSNGMLNNEITSIYEDKSGNLWFGVNGGISRYNGTTFQNYIIDGITLKKDTTGIIIPNMQRPPVEVNSIVEDDRGRLWFATRGYTFIVDALQTSHATYNDKPFVNVRKVLKDRNGQIWLGGQDGLWHYDGLSFVKMFDNFVNAIYQDKSGNIWVTSEGKNGWSLSYCNKLRNNEGNWTFTEVTSGQLMLFEIVEKSDGHIWVGSVNGVFQYDGTTFERLKP